jgi:sigma54-dependent transcription regulator
VIPGGYFFSGAFFQCAEQKGSIPNGIKRVARDWMDLLRDALHEARSQEEVRTDIDIKRTALELNGILLGAQWSGILGQSDPMSARRAILGSLGRVATDAISDEVFESVGTWRAHLERSC